MMKPGKTPALATLALYLLAGLACADSLVVCVAEDGRGVIEEVREGRCVRGQHSSCLDSGPSAGRDRNEASCRCCDSCLDLPLSLSSIHAGLAPERADIYAKCGVTAGSFPRVTGLRGELPRLPGKAPDAGPVSAWALAVLETAVIIV